MPGAQFAQRRCQRREVAQRPLHYHQGRQQRGALPLQVGEHCPQVGSPLEQQVVEVFDELRAVRRDQVEAVLERIDVKRIDVER